MIIKLLGVLSMLAGTSVGIYYIIELIVKDEENSKREFSSKLKQKKVSAEINNIKPIKSLNKFLMDEKIIATPLYQECKHTFDYNILKTYKFIMNEIGSYVPVLATGAWGFIKEEGARCEKCFPSNFLFLNPLLSNFYKSLLQQEDNDNTIFLPAAEILTKRFKNFVLQFKTKTVFLYVFANNVKYLSTVQRDKDSVHIAILPNDSFNKHYLELIERMDGVFFVSCAGNNERLGDMTRFLAFTFPEKGYVFKIIHTDIPNISVSNINDVLAMTRRNYLSFTRTKFYSPYYCGGNVIRSGCNLSINNINTLFLSILVKHSIYYVVILLDQYVSISRNLKYPIKVFNPNPGKPDFDSEIELLVMSDGKITQAGKVKVEYQTLLNTISTTIYQDNIIADSLSKTINFESVYANKETLVNTVKECPHIPGYDVGNLSNSRKVQTEDPHACICFSCNPKDFSLIDSLDDQPDDQEFFDDLIIAFKKIIGQVYNKTINICYVHNHYINKNFDVNPNYYNVLITDSEINASDFSNQFDFVLEVNIDRYFMLRSISFMLAIEIKNYLHTNIIITPSSLPYDDIKIEYEELIICYNPSIIDFNTLSGKIFIGKDYKFACKPFDIFTDRHDYFCLEENIRWSVVVYNEINIKSFRQTGPCYKPEKIFISGHMMAYGNLPKEVEISNLLLFNKIRINMGLKPKSVDFIYTSLNLVSDSLIATKFFLYRLKNHLNVEFEQDVPLDNSFLHKTMICDNHIIEILVLPTLELLSNKLKATIRSKDPNVFSGITIFLSTGNESRTIELSNIYSRFLKYTIYRLNISLTDKVVSNLKIKELLSNFYWLNNTSNVNVRKYLSLSNFEVYQNTSSPVVSSKALPDAESIVKKELEEISNKPIFGITEEQIENLLILANKGVYTGEIEDKEGQFLFTNEEHQPIRIPISQIRDASTFNDIDPYVIYAICKTRSELFRCLFLEYTVTLSKESIARLNNVSHMVGETLDKLKIKILGEDKVIYVTDFLKIKDYLPLLKITAYYQNYQGNLIFSRYAGKDLNKITINDLFFSDAQNNKLIIR